MSIIAWIILGLIAGWIASKVMHGSSSGLVTNLVLGIVGALCRRHPFQRDWRKGELPASISGA